MEIHWISPDKSEVAFPANVVSRPTVHSVTHNMKAKKKNCSIFIAASINSNVQVRKKKKKKAVHQMSTFVYANSV